MPDRFRDRQVQGQRAADERLETDMNIEPDGRVVLGIDNQREGRLIGSRNTADRVQDQRNPQSLFAALLRHRQPADQGGRQKWITGQPPGFLGRQINERQADGGQRVITGYDARRIDANKAVRNSAADILRDVFAEITVQSPRTAGECAPVVGTGQRLDDVGADHREAATRVP